MSLKFKSTNYYTVLYILLITRLPALNQKVAGRGWGWGGQKQALIGDFLQEQPETTVCPPKARHCFSTWGEFLVKQVRRISENKAVLTEGNFHDPTGGKKKSYAKSVCFLE